MFLLVLITYCLSLFGLGLWMGKRAHASARKSRLGWGGVLLLLALGAGFAYAVKTHDETQIYLWGGLIIVALLSMLVLAAGQVLGRYLLRRSAD